MTGGKPAALSEVWVAAKPWVIRSARMVRMLSMSPAIFDGATAKVVAIAVAVITHTRSLKIDPLPSRRILAYMVAPAIATVTPSIGQNTAPAIRCTAASISLA